MHTIRLRGPWEYRLADEPGSGLQRIKLPTDWASVVDDEAVRVEFRRAFQMPTGIGDADELNLVLEQLSGAQVQLNEHDLGVASADESISRFAINSQVESRNVLKVTMLLSKGKPCDGEVRLEIVEA